VNTVLELVIDNMNVGILTPATQELKEEAAILGSKKPTNSSKIA
jgi:hypothetical protein